MIGSGCLCLSGAETEELLQLASDRTAQATPQCTSEPQDLSIKKKDEEPDLRHLEFYVVSWIR
jgi:hypothetical protein